jgi:hypothetical protein
MLTSEIETVWARIGANAGSEFRMIGGAVFHYSIVGGSVALDRTNYRIPKSDFEKALALCPLMNTTVVQHLRAPAYLYAILMDDRIRQIDW